MLINEYNTEEERIAKLIVNAAFNVHKEIGPGLLEKVYEACFCYELEKAGLEFERQVVVPIYYKGLEFNEGLRLDVLVEEQIICELKSVIDIHPVFSAQLLSYLKLMELNLGFLINFNVPLIKKGIKRYKI